MTDKLFEDNDLLDEKSYDTRIAEAANVQPDATYLAEDGYKKRLTEKIETGGSGSVVEFRNVIITNNLTGSGLSSYIALANIVENDGKINVDTGGFYGGDTKAYKIVAPALKSSGDRKEQIFYMRTRTSANAVFTGEYISVLGSIEVSNLRYTLVQISAGSPLDIEITVANG